jgi:hypothetical protein
LVDLLSKWQMKMKIERDKKDKIKVLILEAGSKAAQG